MINSVYIFNRNKLLISLKRQSGERAYDKMRQRVDVHDASIGVPHWTYVIWDDIHVVHEDISIDEASHIQKILRHLYYVNVG